MRRCCPLGVAGRGAAWPVCEVQAMATRAAWSRWAFLATGTVAAAYACSDSAVVEPAAFAPDAAEPDAGVALDAASQVADATETSVDAGPAELRDAGDASVDASLEDAAASPVAERMSQFGLSSFPVPASKIEVVLDRHPAIVAMPTATLDGSFLLEFALGGGKDGFTILSVPASGHCRFVFMRGVNLAYVWQKVAFDVSHQAIEKILAVLDAEQVMRWHKATLIPRTTEHTA
jgi:hypothetical protein